MPPTHGGRGCPAPAQPGAALGFRLGYRPELDGLRGLAVLAVMAYHSGLRRVLPGGFLGVDLFLVLSGFLITALLLQEHRRTGAINVPRFYLRRGLRLLPALFVMLAACCCWAAFRTAPDRAAVICRAALLTACQAANGVWRPPAPMDLLGHTWSLNLEEQFYLAWPVVLLLALRFGGLRRVGWVVGAGVAASALLRAALWLTGQPSAATGLAVRADALLAGCLVAVLAEANRLPKGRPLIAAASSAGLLLVTLVLTTPTGAPWLHLGGFTVVATAAAVVIAALVQSPTGSTSRALSARPLAWTGRVSYGLYLWHFPMLSIAPKLMHGVLPASRHVPGFDGAAACALALAAALLSYYAVERPFLRWRDAPGRRARRPAVSFPLAEVGN